MSVGAVGVLGVVPVRALEGCNLKSGFPHDDVRNSRAAGPRRCGLWTGLPAPSDPSEDSPPPCPPQTGDLQGGHRCEGTFRRENKPKPPPDSNRHQYCKTSPGGMLRWFAVVFISPSVWF